MTRDGKLRATQAPFITRTIIAAHDHVQSPLPLLKTEWKAEQNGQGLAFEGVSVSYLEILLILKYLWVGKSKQQGELKNFFIRVRNILDKDYTQFSVIQN